jgi:hypothetical protein
VDARLPIGADVVRFDQPVKVAIDPRLQVGIEQANEDFVRTQPLFRDSAVSFFCSVSDFECLVKYFINVFCHSSLTSRCTKISIALDDLLRNPSALKFMVAYIRAHFSLIAEIFLNCSEHEIIVLFTKFVRGLIVR